MENLNFKPLLQQTTDDVLSLQRNIINIFFHMAQMLYGKIRVCFNKQMESKKELPKNDIKSLKAAGIEQRTTQLRGIQLKVASLVSELAQREPGKNVARIFASKAASELDISVQSLNKALFLLRQKGILRRTGWRAGRNGWTEYRLAHAIQEKKKMVIPAITRKKSKIEQQSQPCLMEKIIELKDINLFSLRDFGLSLKLLEQLKAEGYKITETVQNSLEALNFILQNKTQHIHNPSGFFINSVRKDRPINPPTEYYRRKELERKEAEKKLKLEYTAQQEEIALQKEQEELAEDEKIKQEIIIPNFETLLKHPTFIAEWRRLLRFLPSHNKDNPKETQIYSMLKLYKKNAFGNITKEAARLVA